MIRIGIVGMGIMGQRFAEELQAPWFRNIATVGGLCDISASRVEKAAGQFGVMGYQSLEDLLDKANVDAVYIATPDDCHASPFIDSVAAGVAVLVEKPLATTVEDARSMLTAAEGAIRPVEVNFSNRFHSRFVTLKHAIDAGTLGEIRCIKAWLSNTQYVPLNMLAWAGRSTCGWFLLSHVLDMSAWLTGAEAKNVFARGLKRTLLNKGIDTYDYLSALVEYDGGISGLYESAWILPEGLGRMVDTEYHIIGSDGCSSIDLGRDEVTISTAERTDWPRASSWTRDSMMGFLQNCEEGRASAEPTRLGFTNTATLVALHESAGSGKLVAVQSP